jgi:hypothetical protein
VLSGRITFDRLHFWPQPVESFRGPDATVTRSFTFLTTTPPNAEMSELYDRMPGILDRQDWPVWLSETEGDGVGSPRNNGPELLEAMAE